MAVSQILAPVIDLVFPPRCPLCGTALAAQTGVCAPCWGELAIPGEPGCALCQRPLGPDARAGTICAPCLASAPGHDGIAAGTLYNAASRKLVLAFKHGGRIALADFMARLIDARLAGDVDGDWLFIPVPLHRWRLWSRGFNQAALLARGLARRRGAGVAVDALIRAKATPMLGQMGRAARVRALGGAIRINPRRSESVSGRRIVLVDDVMTSGATSSACIAALRRAGAAKVRIACFARVLDEALPGG